jgi:hypothetical protein
MRRRSIVRGGGLIAPISADHEKLTRSHRLAGLANADFIFVIASQGEMADAMGFSVV